MPEHILKTQRHYYDQIHSQKRLFDVRYDEKGFSVGDSVVFEEIYKTGWPTGRAIRATITHIMDLKAYADEFFYEFIFDPLVAFQFRIIEIEAGRFEDH